MPRCHRRGNHHLGNNNRYWSNYFAGYNRRTVSMQISRGKIYRPFNSSTHVGFTRKFNPHLQTNQARMDNVELKIQDVKTKINNEIDSRKSSIRTHISKDEKCFECHDGNIYRLEREFLVFLVKRSELGYFKRRKLEKTLRMIRFNINQGTEDIMLYHKPTYLFRSYSLSSVLKVKPLEWKKWESMIKLIGININEYNLSIKQKELGQLTDEYEEITFFENKQKLKICEKCGLENERKAIYCYYCGYKF